jgi:hypothetical protein
MGKTCRTLSERRDEFGMFLIRIVWGGVQLGSLGMSATNWPVVPALGDDEDGEFGGMMIGRRN